jgi:membrane peptidoglycan carboxypeptidase
MDDPRIVMVSTYRPPVVKRKKRRRWPGVLLALIIVAVAAVGATVGGLELYLGNDPRLPRIQRAADYHPKAVSPLVDRSGEWIGEIVGERRTVTEHVSESVRAQVVARVDPTFFVRDRLGQLDFLAAIWRRLRGQPETPRVRLALARHLIGESGDDPWQRFIKEWIVALRLSRHLSREETLTMYLNQAPFGAGVFGVVEGERAVGAAKLAEWAGSTAPLPPREKPSTPAPEYAAAVERELGDRIEADALARLGSTVTTACDVPLTKKIRELVRRQPSAQVVVQEAGTHEVRALVGALEPRPLGGLRALLVVAAALQSQKWTAASKLGGERLRALAAKNPLKAADALLEDGLSAVLVRALALDAGVTTQASGAQLASGQARLSPLELASVWTTFASAGVRRQPQLIVQIGKEPESESRRAPMAAVPPEVVYLTSSLLPRRLVAPDGARGSWFAAFSAERAVLLHVDADAKVALQLGSEVVTAAMRGSAARPLARPASLVMRHLDGSGAPQPSTATSGPEEYFLAGSLPREEILPPE